MPDLFETIAAEQAQPIANRDIFAQVAGEESPVDDIFTEVASGKPGILSKIGSGILTGLRAVDVPRQAILAYAAGLPLSQSVEQVSDPTKTITGAQVIEKQFPESEIAKPTGLPSLAGRIGLEALLEFADPLLLLPGKRATKPISELTGESGKLAKQAGVPIRVATETELKAVESAAKASAVPKPLKTAEQALTIETKTTSQLPKEITGVRLSTETTKKIFNTAEEMLKGAGKTLEPGIPPTYQVAELINQNPERFSFLKEVLAKNNISIADFAQSFIATESSAGRQLAQAATIQRRLGQLAKTDENIGQLLGALEKERPPLSTWELAAHFSNRFINLWRASLVTAWSTATRNLTTQVGRLGANAVEDVLDAAVLKVIGAGTPEDRALGPAFRNVVESFHGLVSRGKLKQAQQILSAFPEHYDQLFSRFSSDIAVSAKAQGGVLGTTAKGIESAFNTWEKGINFFNIVNRGQEFLIRKAAFRAELDRLLIKSGQNINTIAVQDIDPQNIQKAIDVALDLTFAADPKTGPFKSLLDLYQNPLGKMLTFIAPFPRFMYNAWKFQFEHSPLGFLKLLSASERASLAKGQSTSISRALIGTGLLYSAWEMRNNPEIAGEKWYEIKSGDKRIDARPYAPFSSYLFIAELTKRLSENRSAPEIQDLMQGIAASQFRAGAGLYALDQVNELLTGLLTGDPSERATRAIKAFAGEVTGGFLQPLTTFRELFVDYGQYLNKSIAEIAKEEGKVRETREEPFLGPIKRRIPGISQTLPEKELPFRSETIKQEPVEFLGIPISRQFTGLSEQGRNVIEAEVNRLGLKQAEIRPRTGEPKADRLILAEMGPLAERALTQFVTSPQYQRLDDSRRRVVMTEVIKEIRNAAKERAATKSPDIFKPILLKERLSPRVRELLETRKPGAAGR